MLPFWLGQGPWWEGLSFYTHTAPLASRGSRQGASQPVQPPSPAVCRPLSAGLALGHPFTLFLRPPSPPRGPQVPSTGTLWYLDPAYSIEASLTA